VAKNKKLKSHKRKPTLEEVRFARKISRRARRGFAVFIGVLGLVGLYFLAAPVLAVLVFLLRFVFDGNLVVEFFGIPVAIALLLLLAFVVYVVASGDTPSTARAYEVRALAFVSFEPVSDEGVYYAFESADGGIVFITGEAFDKAESFPCLDFALVNLLDDEGKMMGSLVECRSPKEKPVRTIPAQTTKTLAMPANLEIRSGKLENLESDLKRPASEIVEAYTYKRGQGMLRKADQEEWKKRLLRKKVDGRAAFLWSKLAKPNVRLVPKPALDEDTSAPLASKLGGFPDLPKGMAWPTYQFVPWQPQLRPPGFLGRLLGFKPEAEPEPPQPEERPLPFLAQINLADIAKVGCDLPLPEAGLLLFFYKAHECGWAASETTGVRVLFVPEGTETERPSDAPVDPAPTRALECQAGETLPAVEYVEEFVPACSEEHFAEVYEALDQDIDSFMYPGSAFGGWPHIVQGTMELECELHANGIRALPQAFEEAKVRGLDKSATAWRLLLQLDSEDTPELDWGDSGKVYFFCRKEDIAARRFERCCVIDQMA